MNRLAVLPLALLLAACGGADFTAGDGTGPDTGALEPDANASTGGAAGSAGATGGSPSTGGSVGSSGGAAATGGAPASGGAPVSTGGVQGAGGTPADGGLCGAGIECPDPSVCADQLGLCCIGPEDARTECGCAYRTGHVNFPIGCRTGVGQ